MERMNDTVDDCNVYAGSRCYSIRRRNYRILEIPGIYANSAHRRQLPIGTIVGKGP
jgi:hypothetical protein